MLTTAFLTLASAAAAEPRAHRPAYPVVNPVDWISPSDYPLEAQARRAEGTVRVELGISAQGRPTACRVVESAGDRSLDEAACRIMMQRSRFHPARDRWGRPVADTHDMRISWQMPPPEIIPFAPAWSLLRLRFGGEWPPRCSLEVHGTPPVNRSEDTCTHLLRLPEPPDPPRSGGVASLFLLEPRGQAASPPEGDFGTPIEVSRLEIEVAPNGLVTSCKLSESSAAGTGRGDPRTLCLPFTTGHYRFEEAPSGSPTRRARVSFLGYRAD